MLLADKGVQAINLRATGSSMRYTVLSGVSMSGEKKGVPGARIQRDLTINNLQMVYYCQTKA